MRQAALAASAADLHGVAPAAAWQKCDSGCSSAASMDLQVGGQAGGTCQGAHRVLGPKFSAGPFCGSSHQFLLQQQRGNPQPLATVQHGQHTRRCTALRTPQAVTRPIQSCLDNGIVHKIGCFSKLAALAARLQQAWRQQLSRHPLCLGQHDLHAGVQAASRFLRGASTLGGAAKCRDSPS